MTRLVFLGRLEDVAGTPHLLVPLTEATPLAGVLALLPPFVAEALSGPRIKLALNGALVPADGLMVNAGDELAFLPPVSGG